MSIFTNSERRPVYFQVGSFVDRSKLVKAPFDHIRINDDWYITTDGYGDLTNPVVNSSAEQESYYMIREDGWLSDEQIVVAPHELGGDTNNWLGVFQLSFV